MIEISGAFSGFSVTDGDAAEAFYRDTLGLATHAVPMGAFELELPGGTTVYVYAKPDHTPASYTVLNLEVPDIDEALAALAEDGVEPEHYGMPYQGEDGVMRSSDPEDGPTIAWITDPAGNVISLIERRG